MASSLRTNAAATATFNAAPKKPDVGGAAADAQTTPPPNAWYRAIRFVARVRRVETWLS